MLPALLLVPLASLADTVATVVVSTIAAKFASDVYDAATNRTALPAGPSSQGEES